MKQYNANISLQIVWEIISVPQTGWSMGGMQFELSVKGEAITGKIYMVKMHICQLATLQEKCRKNKQFRVLYINLCVQDP